MNTNKTVVTLAVIVGFLTILASVFQGVGVVADTLEMAANLFIAAAVVLWLLGFRQIEVKAPIAFADEVKDGEVVMDAKTKRPAPDFSKPTEFGVVTIRQKDVDISALSNLFSTNFFGGGFMPGPTRQALVEFTNPKTISVKRVSE